MATWAFILVSLIGRAAASDAPPSDVDADSALTAPLDPEGPSPADRLAAARQAYLLGDHDGATATLTALVREYEDGRWVAREVWAEALVFLGEIQYVDGDRIAAESTFRLLLEREPTWRISPYDHPMDVVGVFEMVRAAVRDGEVEAPPPSVSEVRPARVPWWTFAPFGVPQLARDRIAPGVVLASAQIGLAAASVGSWVWIDRLRQPRQEGETAAEGEARLDRARLVRDAFNIPVSAAFYAVWAGGAVDAARWHRRHRDGEPAPEAPRVQVGLGPNGVQVGVTGRW